MANPPSGNTPRFGAVSLAAAGLLLAAPPPVRAAANFNLPLDRPYTMLLGEPLVLERESARQIRSGRPMSSIFPRACASGFDSSRVCGELRGFAWGDSAAGRVGIAPVAGYQYRRDEDDVNAFELGASVSGHRGPVSMHLDARTYTELHEDALRPSYDREAVDRQAAEASGVTAYTSFSRYRANLAYDWAWGRVTVARDAAHWGPGLYENLVFHRNAVPFNQVGFATGAGPFRVYSMYGQLLVEGNREFDTQPKSRSVYAHRYEASLGPDWLAGVSEQMILYDQEEPFAFLPIVPLFVFKGDSWERMNNGSIAFDLTWRASRWARIYGEFLIDDLQSPAGIFGDHWGNKWGAMGGAQIALSAGSWEAGFVAEASTLEPWVYTHYLEATAQAANQGAPLGNPGGPGQRALKLAAYATVPRGLSFMAESRFGWHGNDTGGAITDLRPRGKEDKAGFWESATGSASLAFKATWRLRYGGVQAGVEWDGSPTMQGRLFASPRLIP